MAVVCKKLNFAARIFGGILLLLFIAVGCECPARKKDAAAGVIQSSDPVAAGRLFVYKGDQSQQCGMQKGVTAEEMQRELSGITLYSMKKGHDQLMRTAVCGAPTGQINIYEIDAKDLQAAEQRGFIQLKSDVKK